VRIQFILPSGYVFSPQDQGSDNAKDSDANTTTGKTDCFYFTDGMYDYTFDAGLYKLASVGDFVWEDLNENGVQDQGEMGIDDVTVELYKCGGSLVGSTTTDNTGYYLFSSLTPGSYYLQFVAPADFLFSPKDATGEATDSDADQSTGKTDCFTLASGDNLSGWDGGLYEKEQPPEEPPPVPSVTTWGIAALTVVLAGSGILILRKKALVGNR
jgi:hypothetical protein